MLRKPNTFCQKLDRSFQQLITFLKELISCWEIVITFFQQVVSKSQKLVRDWGKS